jgi:hypothetical protein
VVLFDHNCSGISIIAAWCASMPRLPLSSRAPLGAILTGALCWVRSAVRKNAFAAATSLVGLSRKSTVLPSRSTARYR